MTPSGVSEPRHITELSANPAMEQLAACLLARLRDCRSSANVLTVAPSGMLPHTPAVGSRREARPARAGATVNIRHPIPIGAAEVGSARPLSVRPRLRRSRSASRLGERPSVARGALLPLIVRWGAPRADGRVSAAAGCAAGTIRRSPAVHDLAVDAAIATVALRKRDPRRLRRPAGRECNRLASAEPRRSA